MARLRFIPHGLLPLRGVQFPSTQRPLSCGQSGFSSFIIFKQHWHGCLRLSSEFGQSMGSLSADVGISIAQIA